MATAISSENCSIGDDGASVCSGGASHEAKKKRHKDTEQARQTRRSAESIDLGQIQMEAHQEHKQDQTDLAQLVEHR
ncbi:MAG: hypothetical protein WDO18_18080 [Acidobacteriota bacterium]